MSDQDWLWLPVHGPGKTARGRARLPASRHRPRPQLSCNLCRRRKLRCDRKLPCTTCAERGLGQSCTYISQGNGAPAAGSEQQLRNTEPSVRQRIQQLETLVVDLMQKTSNEEPSQEKPSPAAAATLPELSPALISSPPPASEGVANAKQASPLPGSIRQTKSGTSYVHGAHWAAVLDGIAELKDYFEQDAHEMQVESPPGDMLQSGSTVWSGPQLLRGCSGMLPTREEIIDSVPARSTVDRLVSRYFNSFEMSPGFIHSVEFLKEYDEFWANPSATPITWLALLFTIMCLAAQFQKCRLDPADAASDTQPNLDETIETFRQRTVECLISGNYAHGGPYVLETLTLYMAVELFFHNDAQIGIWILLGTIVQLAMHMGYHRNPAQFKGMSAFEGEMRNRIWATVVELDLGISSQMGLPRLVKPWQADAPEPLNLLDTDFDKTSAEMPPPRPESDLIPMLYRLAKSRLMTVIGSIWDFATDTRPHTQADVMRMDQRLQDAHVRIPECARWQSMTQCITDSPQVIIQKLFLEIIFQHARLVLHRRHLQGSGSAEASTHHESQETCIKAALTLLEYQRVLQEETQPFGQLYQERWRVSSLINHDFLLATSVLCLYLEQAPESTWSETILTALSKSYGIWLRSSGTSDEARKVAKALSVILGRRSPDAAGNTPFNGSPPDVAGAGLPPSSVLGNNAVSNWPTLSGDGLGGLVSPGGWQFVDSLHTMSSMQWPWNIQ